MTAYIFLLLLTTFLAYTDKQSKSNKGLIAAFALIGIFAGLRYGYGSDYMGYLRAFNRFFFSEVGDDFSEFRTEWGWNIISTICQPIGFFGMIILLSIVEYTILCRFYLLNLKYPYHWLGLLCFTLNTSLMLTGLSMMRQFLAMCIIILSTEFIVNRKWIKSLLIVVIAAQFHTSAFIFIPFVFLGFVNFSKWKKKHALLYGIIIILIFFTASYMLKDMAIFALKMQAFSDYGTSYVGLGDTVNLFSVPRLYEIFILFSVLFYFEKLSYSERVIVILFSITYIFNGFLAFMPGISRIGMYFTLYGTICVPLIIRSIKNKQRSVMFLLVYLCFLSYRCISFFNEPIWETFREYHTIFEVNWQ